MEYTSVMAAGGAAPSSFGLDDKPSERQTSTDKFGIDNLPERQTTTGSTAESIWEDIDGSQWEDEENGVNIPSLRPIRAVTPSTQRMTETYKISEKLGQGSFGDVSLATCRTTGEQLAAKVMLTDKIERWSMFQNEFEIASRLQHPNIVKVHDIFINEERCCLIVDLCSGGDMVSFVESHKHEVQGVSRRVYIPPGRVILSKLLSQMLQSVTYLHHHRIAHRDIKLDNFLMSSSESKDLKLIDFGMAKTIQKEQLLTGVVGTMGYIAPEVLDEVGYGLACDSWSLGVCAYLFLAGQFPIPVKEHGTHAELAALTKGHEIDHKRVAQLPIPQAGKDIPKVLLQIDPSKRTSPKEILSKNTWLRTVGRGEAPGCCTIS